MSKVIWSNTQDYDYWMDKASDDEVLTEYCEQRGIGEDEVEPPYAEFDDKDRLIEYNYDKMRDWICRGEFLYDMAWDDFKYNIIPSVEKQLNDDVLIIDGEIIYPEYNYDRKHPWFSPIATAIEGYYGDAEIEVNDDEEIIGWYTLPSDESHLYRLIRHIPEIKEEVDRELESRLEEEDEDYYGYDGATGRELWLAVYDEYDKDDIDWESVEEYLVPIMNPYLQ